MKKSPILLSIIILFTLNCMAQQQKGKFFIGGLAGISTNNNDSQGETDYRNTSNTLWNINVSFGYFVSNTFLVGLSTGYIRQIYTSDYHNNYGDGNRESNNHQFAIGPFIREYFKISDKVNFFLEWDATVGFGKESSTDSRQNYPGELYVTETNGKVTSFSTGIYPGVSIKLSKWLFIDANIGRLGYDYSKYKPDSKSNSDEETMSNSFAFTFNTFRFGLSAKLGK
ncbi:MAG: PorT family protein [Bacteroidales bacterium]|nr:PorT family protein [Bacteroidales bacterium]